MLDPDAVMCLLFLYHTKDGSTSGPWHFHFLHLCSPSLPLPLFFSQWESALLFSASAHLGLVFFATSFLNNLLKLPFFLLADHLFLIFFSSVYHHSIHLLFYSYFVIFPFILPGMWNCWPRSTVELTIKHKYLFWREIAINDYLELISE